MRLKTWSGEVEFQISQEQQSEAGGSEQRMQEYKAISH